MTARKLRSTARFLLVFLVLATAIVVASGQALPVALTLTERDGQTLPALVLNAQDPPALQGECTTPGQVKLVLVYSNVHAEASEQSTVLGQMNTGELVCAAEEQGEFARVRSLITGLEGWLELAAMPTVAVLGFSEALAGAGVIQPTAQGDAMLTELAAAEPPAPTATPTPVPPPTATPTPTPLPSGGITGQAGIVVSQSLLLNSVVVTGSMGGLGVVNDDRTAFTVAAEVASGSTFNIELRLRNASSATLTGDLDLTIPQGVSVSVSAADGVTGVGQVGASTWKFVLAGSHNNGITDLTIRVRMGLAPGFQTIGGRLKQVAF